MNSKKAKKLRKIAAELGRGKPIEEKGKIYARMKETHKSLPKNKR